MQLFRRLQQRSDEHGEEPIREELFSIERLEQFAGDLAAAHRALVEPRRGRSLMPRLEENGRELIAAYRVLAETICNERAISPAAATDLHPRQKEADKDENSRA